jgi:TolA-binding protein
MQPHSDQSPSAPSCFPVYCVINRVQIAFFCLVGILAGCASAPTIKKTDLTEERFSEILEQLNEQRNQIQKLTTRLSEVKNQSEAKKPEKPAAPAVDPVVPVEKLTPSEPEEESDEQDDALSDDGNPIADSSHESMHWYYQGARSLREKQYDEAVNSLRKFLTMEPSHIYADRAEYLIAESHFKNQEFGLAVVATHRLEADHPYSFRIPEAQYLRAMSYLKMGQKGEATSTLRELVKRYPEHPISDRASHELAALSTTAKPVGAPLILDDREF